MRRIIYFLVAFTALLVIASFLSSPLVKIIAKKQLQSTFPKANVSIGGCILKPTQLLSFSDIQIKKDKVYDFKIKEARIQFSPSSLFKRQLLRVGLREAFFNISTPHKSIVDFGQQLNLRGPNIFSVPALELANIKFDLGTKELTASGKISCQVDISRQLVESLKVRVSSLESQGLYVENALLSASQISSDGELRIEKIKYDKAVVTDTNGKVSLKGKEIFFDGLGAKLFNGEVRIDARCLLDQSASYVADIKLVNIDLQRLNKDFKLEEKLQMTGKLSGSVHVEGRGADIKVLAGNFSTSEEGGTLVITDEAMLEKLAASSKQPMDILVESFKNYHYNTGIMKLSGKGDDLVFEVDLAGEAGKRNLSVVFHDFLLLY